MPSHSNRTQRNFSTLVAYLHDVAVGTFADKLTGGQTPSMSAIIQKRTKTSKTDLSVKGQKRPFARQQNGLLFDYLVGKDKQSW
jgi:hypothetical protein